MIAINQIWINKWIIQGDQRIFHQILSGFQYYTNSHKYFLNIYKIWSFQHNLLSIITPRNFVLEFSLIVSPFISIYTFGWALFLLENIMKWVFLIFRDSLFAFNHKEISFNSSFNVFIIKSLSLPLMNRLLSSAKSIGNVFLHTVARSFIYIWEIKVDLILILVVHHILWLDFEISFHCKLQIVVYQSNSC